MKALHLRFHGRVQGVGFRAFVLGQGRNASLSGWVRNMQDGTVEALFAGEDSRVDAVLDTCRNAPFPMRVDDVEVFPAQMPMADGFHVVA